VDGNGVSELSIYGLNATGAAQLKLLDASTGVLVGDLLVP